MLGWITHRPPPTDADPMPVTDCPSETTTAEYGTPAWEAEAKRLWDEYQRTHDLTGQRGRTAAVDPATGRVWLGDSPIEVIDARAAEGLTGPVLFERVGYPTYLRRGGRRCSTDG